MDNKLNFSFNIITPDFAYNLLYYTLNTRTEKTLFLLKKLYEIKLLNNIDIPEFNYKQTLNNMIQLKLQGFSKEAILEKLAIGNDNPLILDLKNSFSKIDESIFDNILQDKIDQYYTSTFVQHLFTTVVDSNNPTVVLQKIKQQIKRYTIDTDFNTSFKEMILSSENMLDTILEPTDIKHLNPGFVSFNNIFPKGLETQRLYVIGGATGRGKSVLLHNLAYKLIENGNNVYHFTLENSLEETINRYLSLVSQVDLSNLEENKDFVKQKMRDFMIKTKGQLIIKEYPAGLLTKADIIEYIKAKLSEKNITPDVIIIDYLDLMNTFEKYNEVRFKLTQISNDLKQLAQTFNCVVLTATQLNREAVRTQTANESNISEAYSKIFAADAFITLNASDVEIKKNLLRIFVAKNRTGASRLEFLFKTDFAKASLYDLNRKVDKSYFDSLDVAEDEDSNDTIEMSDDDLRLL